MIHEICVDVDGVLAKFTEAACKAHGREGYPVTHWNFYKDWGITTNEFWAAIERIDYFWERLDQCEWAGDLVTLLRKLAPVCALTCPSQDPRSWSGKYIWLRQFGFRHQDIRMCGGPKEFGAKSGRLLIDDNEDHVTEWQAAGGIAVLFPQCHNSNREHAGDPLAYVKRKLRPYFVETPDIDWGCAGDEQAN